MYKLLNSQFALRLSDGANVPKSDPAYQDWIVGGGIPQPADVVTVSQFDTDVTRYTKRARAKDQILAEFAAENMSRVRSGAWTTAQLIGLTQDAGLKALLDNVNTLSFEIAVSMVPGLTNALLTPAIKAGW